MKQIPLLLQVQIAELKNKKIILGWIGIVLIVFLISTFSYEKNPDSSATKEAMRLTLGVANEDDSEYAKLLINYFRENKNFAAYVDLVQEKESVLQGRLNKEELDAYLVIPPMFAERLMEMEHVPVRAVVSMRQPTKALIFKQVLTAYETYIKNVEISCSVLYDRMKEEEFSYEERNKANMEISLDLIFTALGKDEFFRLRKVEAEKEPALTEQYALTALFFSCAFLCFPVGLRILKFRQNRMLERMKTMRFSMGAVVTATVVPYVLLSSLTVALFLLLRKRWEPWLFLASLSCLILMTAVAVFLGSVVKKKKDYMFAFCVLLMTCAVLGGGVIPVRYLPDVFLRVAGVMPNFLFVQLLSGQSEAVRRVFAVLAVCSLLLLLFAVLCLMKRGEAEEDV